VLFRSCGYENSFEAELCEYCGGNIAENQTKCPECGFILEAPHTECPVCNDQTHGEDFDATDENETAYKKYTPPLPKISKASWEHLKEWNADEEAAGEAAEQDFSEKPITNDVPLEHPGGSNFLIQSIDIKSFSLFFGMIGLILGLIGGAFAGTASLIPGLPAFLPEFYQSTHGKITGGIVFGLTGGAAGLTGFAIIGFLYAVFINIVLSFLGGLKIRIEKIDF
jgi:hypothetical protein